MLYYFVFCESNFIFSHSCNKKTVWKKVNGNDAGYRMVKVSVFSCFYYSSYFSNVICFLICTDSRAGKFACCHCIWNGGNEYRCILSN